MEATTQTAIKASELRIGNWLITYATALPQYFKVTSWHIKYFDENGFRDESPIPLTPEILEKCCFDKNDLSDAHLSPLHLMKEDRGYYMHLSFGYVNRMNPIVYLHHLQNLYFDITGRELQINL